ncbi:MAG: acetate/propionate family kinase [Christensenellales bacterium]
MKILVLNCGSSSLKYQLINMEDETVMAKGYFERIGHYDSFVTHKVNGEKYRYDVIARDHGEAIKFVLKQFTDPKYPVISSLDEITAIGHRVVHGGEKFKESVIVNEDVKKGIEDAIVFAPLHNPAHLQGIKACELNLPGKVNVAVFDTAFHQTMPKEHYLYPIPYEYYEKYGIRKYGAHGTSHKYIANRIAELLGKPIEDLKIISCHIGQGASICAIQNGKSVDTSMGLTPLGGVAMGSRSGDLDPSVVTFLMEKENLNPAQMEHILNKKSGLYALSGISSDNRDVERAIAQGDQRAIDSLKEYDYIIAQYIGKYAVTMNGVDVITFTAGVGEKGPVTRSDVCKYLGFMGVELDEEINNTTKDVEKDISKESSKVKVWVVPTNEELMIARETANLIK